MGFLTVPSPRPAAPGQCICVFTATPWVTKEGVWTQEALVGLDGRNDGMNPSIRPNSRCGLTSLSLLFSLSPAQNVTHLMEVAGLGRPIISDGLGSPCPHPHHDAGSHGQRGKTRTGGHHCPLPISVCRPSIAKLGTLDPQHPNSSWTVNGISAFLHILSWPQA